MEPELTAADQEVMRSLGIDRATFMETRKKELAEKAKRAETRIEDSDADGLTPDDLEAMQSLGVSREAFLETRRLEKATAKARKEAEARQSRQAEARRGGAEARS